MAHNIYSEELERCRKNIAYYKKGIEYWKRQKFYWKVCYDAEESKLKYHK